MYSFYFTWNFLSTKAYHSHFSLCTISFSTNNLPHLFLFLFEKTSFYLLLLLTTLMHWDSRITIEKPFFLLISIVYNMINFTVMYYLITTFPKRKTFNWHLSKTELKSEIVPVILYRLWRFIYLPVFFDWLNLDVPIKCLSTYVSIYFLS